MKRTLLMLILAPLLLASCGDSGYEYSDVAISVTIDNNTHQDATLATAMNAASPGTFCTIRTQMRGGAMMFVFSNNKGLQSTKPFNAIDDRLQTDRHLGLNNGIIVGFSSMPDATTGAPRFYAYDRECPYCFDVKALPLKSYPLSVDENGIATCNNCKRQFDLGNGGSGTGQNASGHLTPYRATTTGPFGVLHVM